LGNIEHIKPILARLLKQVAHDSDVSRKIDLIFADKEEKLGLLQDIEELKSDLIWSDWQFILIIAVIKRDLSQIINISGEVGEEIGWRGQGFSTSTTEGYQLVKNTNNIFDMISKPAREVSNT